MDQTLIEFSFDSYNEFKLFTWTTIIQTGARFESETPASLPNYTFSFKACEKSSDEPDDAWKPDSEHEIKLKMIAKKLPKFSLYIQHLLNLEKKWRLDHFDALILSNALQASHQIPLTREERKIIHKERIASKIRAIQRKVLPYLTLSEACPYVIKHYRNLFQKLGERAKDNPLYLKELKEAFREAKAVSLPGPEAKLLHAFKKGYSRSWK
jgi:hypothetical protein